MKATIFIFMLLAYLACCSYLFVRGWQALPPARFVRITYSVLFTFLVFGYAFGIVFRDFLPLWLSDLIEVIGSTWFIALVYLLIAAILIDIVRFANHYLHFFPKWLTADYAKTKLLTLCSVLGIVATIFAIGYYKFANPKVNSLTLLLAKQPVGKELKVVVASDIHMGSVVGSRRLQKFVDLINEQQPDVVLMVGDVFNADLRPVKARQMDEVLRQLKAPLGVYAVLGNHEYIGRDVDGAIAYLEQSNIRVLRDTVADVNGYFYLVGRDDRTNSSRRPLEQLLDKLDRQKPVILMDHQPYHLEEAEQHGIDLMVCGHTHNGQVWPINWVVKRMYEVAQGYKQKGNTHIYVSAGLGLWGPPFRIGTASEILVVDLKL